MCAKARGTTKRGQRGYKTRPDDRMPSTSNWK